MPGVALQLVDERGNEVARTISEFDGFFLFERIAYGRYRLMVDREVAQKLAVKPHLTGRGALIELNRAQDVIRLGPIKLEHPPEPDETRLIAAAPALAPSVEALPE